MILVVLTLAMIPVAAPPYPLSAPIMTILVLPAGPLLGMPVPPMPGWLVIVAHGDRRRGAGTYAGATAIQGPL